MRSDQTILDNCRALARTGFWPKMPLVIDPQTWLENFSASEKEVALALLESFTYLNEESTTKLLVSAFRQLGNAPLPAAYSEAYRDPDVWSRFRADMIVTYPTGERPNASDSGHLLVRMARQVLGVHETQIFDPANALAVLSARPNSPLVLIDDFAGSGDQFITTWQRKYPTQAGDLSFAKFSQLKPIHAYYVAPVITWVADRRITQTLPAVHICAGHKLSARYSATDPHSVIVPSALRPQIAEVIRHASARAGIDEHMAFGYHNLALALAFSHSVPDATLPLFWHDSNTWKALVTRS